MKAILSILIIISIMFSAPLIGESSVYTVSTSYNNLLSNEEQNGMLELGRLDIALYSELTGYAALREYGYTGIRHLEPPLASREMFLYLHSKNSHLVPELDGDLKSMKNDGSYDRTVREALRRHLGSLGFEE